VDQLGIEAQTAHTSALTGVLKPADGLPELKTQLPPVAVVARLDALARRGKLAGFEPGRGEELFSVLAFGNPFDHRLSAAADVNGSVTSLKFSLCVTRRMPAIFALILIVTIWPGVWLTHSMLVTYFSWYALTFVQTCMWYLPLTVLPIPWFWPRMMRKSAAAARTSAAEQIEVIAAAVGATVAGNGYVGPAGTGQDGTPGA
jgi:hypothetical protein